METFLVYKEIGQFLYEFKSFSHLSFLSVNFFVYLNKFDW